MDIPERPFDHPKRIALMVLLERHHCLVFSELYKTLQLSRGSVNSHLKALEDYHYITKDVTFVNTSSRVMVCITPEGLQALKKAKIKWSKLLNLKREVKK